MSSWFYNVYSMYEGVKVRVSRIVNGSIFFKFGNAFTLTHMEWVDGQYICYFSGYIGNLFVSSITIELSVLHFYGQRTYDNSCISLLHEHLRYLLSNNSLLSNLLPEQQSALESGLDCLVSCRWVL